MYEGVFIRWRHHLQVTQFSPSLLKSEGVPVYRCVQHEGEFVLTFPRAYHAGFNCGFNCAEAVNVAPIDWLPIGQDAVELYREQARKITISHDKLLLGAAKEAIRAQWDILFLKRNTADNLRWKSMCGPDSTICKSLKARIEMELTQRKDICPPSQCRKIDPEFDSTDRECAFCYYDLHLSACGCPCSPEKYACLVHAKQLCSCEWSKRFFLLRYDISELNILADALGGKLSAIHRWGVSHLGLSLSSCVKREKDQNLKILRRSTDGPRRSYMSQASTVSLSPSLVCNEQKSSGNKTLNSSEMNAGCHSVEQLKSGNDSPQKEPWVKNGLPCTLNNGTGQLQYTGGPGGHKNSELSLPTPPGPSFSSSVATRPLNTSGEYTKNAYGSLPVMADRGCDMKPTLESSNNSHRLLTFSANTSLCYSNKDKKHMAPEIRASVTTVKDSSQACAALSQPFVRTVSRAQTVSQEASASVFASKSPVGPSLVTNTNGGFGSGNAHLGHPNFGCLQRKSESLSGPEARGHSPLLVQPALENGSPQKGPRIANVVHRFKSSVELLEIGAVLSGRLWSSSQAIFPKGFRSRVKYFSILDPTQMAYYISEILDAGLQGPLFTVTMENCPGEVFINVSPTKCWNMVRERLNMEIRRQLSVGRANLPTLQPPGSVDGLEMFGLSSPLIVKAIEAQDIDSICTEYWRSRPRVVAGGHDSRHMPPTQGPPHIALRGLFQRANRDELQALRSLMTSSSTLDERSRQQAAQILDEEIAKQWR
ncbi:unnamed protein product [Urochloa humidicola]